MIVDISDLAADTQDESMAYIANPKAPKNRKTDESNLFDSRKFCYYEETVVKTIGFSAPNSTYATGMYNHLNPRDTAKIKAGMRGPTGGITLHYKYGDVDNCPCNCIWRAVVLANFPGGKGESLTFSGGNQ